MSAREDVWQLSALSPFAGVSVVVINKITDLKLRANMDVPLAINDVGSCQGLKGFIGESSTISPQTDVEWFCFFHSYKSLFCTTLN